MVLTLLDLLKKGNVLLQNGLVLEIELDGKAAVLPVCLQSANIHFLHLELIHCIEQQACVLQTEGTAR